MYKPVGDDHAAPSPRCRPVASAATAAHRRRRMLRHASSMADPQEASQRLLLAITAQARVQSRLAPFRGKSLSLDAAARVLSLRRRSLFYRQLVLYAGFVAVVLSAVLSLPLVLPNESNAAYADLLLDEEFPNVLSHKKTFWDVMAADEMFDWAEGPLVGARYASPLPTQVGLGSVRVRQARVAEEPCADAVSAALGLQCAPSWGDGRPAAAAFLGIEPSAAGLSELWGSRVFTPSLLTSSVSYGREGFSVFLPGAANASAAAALVRELRSADFVDAATRAVEFQATFFAPGAQLYTTAQMVFEFSPTGYVERTARISSLRLFERGSAPPAPLLLLAAAVLAFAFAERPRTWLFLKEPWNVLNVALVGVNAALVGAWAAYVVESGAAAADALAAAADPSLHLDLQPLAFRVALVYNLAAVAALLALVGIFRYLRLSHRLNLLWRTLQLAATDLLSFAFIGGTVFVGFSLMAMLALGAHLRSFHNVSTSTSSVWRLLLGSFDEDFEQMQQASPLASFFFYSYTVLMVLVSLNMFIAIMNEHFLIAQREKDSAVSDDADVDYDVLAQASALYDGLRLRVADGFSDDLVPAQRVRLVDARWLSGRRRQLRVLLRAAVLVVRLCQTLSRGSCPAGWRHDSQEYAAEETPEQALRRRAAKFVPLVTRSRSGRASAWLGCLRVGDELRAHAVPLRVLETRAPPLESARDPGRHGFVCTVAVQHPGGSLLSDVLVVPLRVRLRFALRVAQRWARGLLRRDTWRAMLVAVETGGELSLDDVDALVGRLRAADPDADFVPFHRLRQEVQVRLATRDGGAGAASDDAGLEQRVDRVMLHLCTLFHGASTWVATDRGDYARLFRPRPIGTAHVRLAASLLQLAETLAEHVHETWALGRSRGGWRYGPELDPDCKLHPDLQPYASLSHETQEYDRRTSIEALRVIQAIGFAIEQSDVAGADVDVELGGAAVPPGHVYEARPVDTSGVALDPVLEQVVELLAENTHEVWAHDRMRQGWSYGPVRDGARKHHPSLIPFGFLSEAEKQMNRATAVESVKLISLLGHRFVRAGPVESWTFATVFNSAREFMSRSAGSGSGSGSVAGGGDDGVRRRVRFAE